MPSRSAVDRSNRRYDVAHGVDTWQRVEPPRLESESASKIMAERYGPAPAKTVYAILEQLPIDYREYTFLDLGAGKGKTMLLASEYPFARIIGVELATNIHAVGAVNMRSFRSARQQCFDIELLLGDAIDVELPDGKTVFFLSAPFWGSVLERVLARMKRSLEAHPRDAIVCWIDEDVHTRKRSTSQTPSERGLHAAHRYPATPG